MPDISSGMPIGPQPGDPGMGGQSATPGGPPGMGNSAMLKIMGPIALAYLQNIAQQSQQGDGTTSNQPGDPVTEALENATGQDLDGDGDGTGVQATPPGGKSLQTAHANQSNNGTIPLGTVSAQGAAMPPSGGKTMVRGSSGGGRVPMRGGGGGSSISRIGGHVRPSKPPPVAKIKTPPKDGKTPPPA